jgi:lincosamide nucleotidyltransferase A/C/D/E
MMRAPDVLEIVARLDEAGIPVWLDGGWGIDALLGAETRDHDDLDVVIALSDAEAAVVALGGLGYAMAEDELPTRFVMRAAGDRRVDFHTVSFDADGGGIQQLQDGSSWRYPPEGFSGHGQISGRVVACLTAEVQLLCHLGYPPDETDIRDVAALAGRFGLALPSPYGP